MIVTTDAVLLTGATCGGGGGGAGWLLAELPEAWLFAPGWLRVAGAFGAGWLAAMVLESGANATAAGCVAGADVTVPPDPLVGGWLPEPGRARVAIIWPSCPPLPGITCIAPACIMGMIITQLRVYIQPFDKNGKKRVWRRSRRFDEANLPHAGYELNVFTR